MLHWHRAVCLGLAGTLMFLLGCDEVGAVRQTVEVRVPAGTDAEGLEAALASAVRERAGLPAAERGGIRVVLARGVYPLSRAWLISAEASGTEQHPTVIEAEVPGGAVLQGARALKRVEAGADLWRFEPPAALDRAALRSGGQLFVNGRRAVLARHPNEGQAWLVSSPVPLKHEKPEKAGAEAFEAAPEDIAKLAELVEGQQDRAIVEVMQSWTSGQHRLSQLDAERRLVRVAPAAKWPFQMFGLSQRYYVENVPRALDAAGEWIAEERGLLYRPRSQDSQGKGEMEAYWPRVERLLQVQGQPGRPVEHLQLKGLAFAYTGQGTSMQGWVDMQAAVDVGAAIEVDHAHDFSISGCSVRHTVGYGIWLRRGVRDAAVSGCVLDDLGAGGIRVGTADTASGDGVTGAVAVRRNLVMNTGRVYPGGVGIWIGRSFDNEVSANVIAHTTYTAISVGWQWTGGAPTSGRNRIQSNAMFDVGQREMSDLGGIYTLGPSPGTVISGNYIRGVEDYPDYGAGAWGIYNDESTEGLLVEDNVVVQTRSGGYHLHYGRDNTVRRNLFAGGRQNELRWSRPDRSGALQLDGNAIVAGSANPVLIRGAAPELSARDNVMAAQTAAADDGRPGGAARREGCGKGCSVRSGLGVAWGQRAADVTVRGGNDADEARWSAVIRQAQTLIASYRDTGLSDAAPRPGRQVARRRDGAVLELDFTRLPVGSAPGQFRVFPWQRKELVSVQEDEDSGRCLRFQDGAPGLAKYEPYAFVQPDLETGLVTAEFTVRIDAQAAFIHEWRDEQTEAGQTSGPKLMLTRSGLSVGGKLLQGYEPGQWLKINVSAQLGGSTVGGWGLTVTDEAGKTRQWSNLPLASPRFARLKWFGFISDTEKESRTCVRRILLTAPLGD